MGNLYLIPTGLGSEDTSDYLPENVKTQTIQLRHFIVEDLKTARRFLRKLSREFPIDESHFYILNKRTDPAELYSYIQPCLNGVDVGLMSEAGCPGVADPGGSVVSLAHSKNIKVVPFVGPSSILLTLMASGFSGQNFSFHGYLPKERKDRIRIIREFESNARKNGTTHLFMDTPFRNMHVLDDLLNELSDATEICIASNITLPSESIRTMNAKEWRDNAYDLNKKPTMFAIGKRQ